MPENVKLANVAAPGQVGKMASFRSTVIAATFGCVLAYGLPQAAMAQSVAAPPSQKSSAGPVYNFKTEPQPSREQGIGGQGTKRTSLDVPKPEDFRQQIAPKAPPEVSGATPANTAAGCSPHPACPCDIWNQLVQEARARTAADTAVGRNMLAVNVPPPVLKVGINGQGCLDLSAQFSGVGLLLNPSWESFISAACNIADQYLDQQVAALGKKIGLNGTANPADFMFEGMPNIPGFNVYRTNGVQLQVIEPQPISAIRPDITVNGRPLPFFD